MPQFWENDGVVAPAPAQPRAAPRPVLSVPNVDQEADNARADIQLGNDQVRTDLAIRGEARGADQQRFQRESGLRGEFQALPEVKAYRTSVRQAAIALQTPATPAGDNSLIAAIAQLQDPLGSVREGDVNVIQAGQPAVAAFVENLKKQLGSGGMFTPEYRDQLRESALSRLTQINQSYNAFRQQYAGLAQADGIDPVKVIGEHDGRPYFQTIDQWLKARQKPAQANQPTNADIYGGGVRFGMDGGPGPNWAREQALRDLGVNGEQESQLLGFFKANKGNPGLTIDAVKAYYNQIGARVPSDDQLIDTIDKVRRGIELGPIDTSAAEKAYRDRLDAQLKQEGFDPTSGGAYAARALRGAEMGLSDELQGVGGALSALVNNQGVADGYRLARDKSREAFSQMEDQQGGLGVAAELAGGLGGALVMPGGQARGVAALARQGAAQGALAGYGYGEGLGGSLAGAAGGMVAGGLGGAAFGKAGDVMAARAASRAAVAPSDGAAVIGAAGRAAPETPQPIIPPRDPTDMGNIGGMAEAAAPAAAEPVLTQAEQTEIAALAKKATGWGLGARSAKKTLATKFAANPEAAAAAKRLGIDIPSDVLSDNAQGQMLAGLSRSEVGSTAETAWKADAARVAQYADQAMADLGGTSDLAQVSDDILNRLNATATNLQNKAGALRDEVNAAIDPAARVEASALQDTLARTINDYGGLAEAKAAMTPVEKDLLKMLGEGEEAIKPTYARLNRLRQDVGDAWSKGKGPWADVNRQQLGMYYKALQADQLAAVEQFGGRELADKQVAANELFTKMFDQRAEMQDLFGKGLEKGLAPLLRQAVTTGAKGDATALTKLLERLPEDARGGALMSAIMAQSRSSAAHGGFSFANFTKLYRGLRENGPIFAKVAKAIGPQGTSILNDLHIISARMADAETRVLKTGKANQVLANAMQVESMIGGIMNAAASKGAAGAGAAVGGAVGGPAGSAAGATLAMAAKNAVQGAGTSRLEKVHALLSSPQFRQTISDISAGVDVEKAASGLWGNMAFHNLGRSVGLLTPRARREWLMQLTTRTLANDNAIAADLAGFGQRAAGGLGQNAAALPVSASPRQSANAGTEQTQGEGQ